MKFIILIISLLGLNLFAKEAKLQKKCEKQTRAIASKSSFFGLFSPGLKWFSANSDDIKNAYCKSSEEKSLDLLMIRNFIQLKSDNAKERKDANINGVQFSGESSVMIDAFKNLTTAIVLPHAESRVNQQNIQTKFNINPFCKKVMCAVEKIWGQEMGPKMLYLYLKYSFNGSEFAYINTDRFENSELDDVILGLDDAPLFFAPLGRENQRLSHFARGRTLQIYADAGTPNVQSNGVVILFDNWSEETRPERQYTVFHELVHNLSVRLNFLDISPSWTKLSGWVKKGDEWSHSRNACFSSDYAATNSMEDFAESASAYRYNGEWFKERCPEKYQFMKENFFKNLEYLDSCTCSPIESSDELQNFSNGLISDLKKSMNVEAEFKKENCLGDILNHPANQNDAQACYSKIMKNLISTINESNFESAVNSAGVVPGKNSFVLLAQFNEYLLNHPDILEMDSVVKEKILALMNYKIPVKVPLEVASPELYRKKCAAEIRKKDWAQIKKCVDRVWNGSKKN